MKDMKDILYFSRHDDKKIGHTSQNHEHNIKFYSEEIKLNPENSDAYFNRGNAYVRLKNYEQAITDYSEVIRLNPDNEKAYYNRGTAYVRLKNYEQAITDY
ncbi:tetratricopeptide repeat protein, partial [Fructobacillus tropaeoli]|uniref:tetratricopeptide repeat protein n=1 Tax=Fructobacillus tropaeoli TaxID=709323 RepID=UPI0030C86914